jgi:1-acyl-sn-glycerol-3-phosphate acyltransferase
VANRTGGLLTEPAVVMTAVRDRWARTARVAGIVDVAPIGAVGRRLGGILARPDEVRGVLRDGHVAVILAGAGWRGGRVGEPDRSLVAMAAEVDVPVVPLALRGRPWGRRYHAAFGEPLQVRGPGPLAVAELADAARAAIQERLDDLDPPRWFW